MKLGVSIRPNKAKSERTLIRHQGNIPAVLYSGSAENLNLTIDGGQFRACLRTMEKGRLPTTVFEFEVEGKSKRAVVKEIQYHPTTYEILHLDFQEAREEKIMRVNVPVEPTRVADCVGIKLGGFLRLVKRNLKTECELKDLPNSFEVDVRNLNIGQSIRVKDLQLPEGCRLLEKPNDVLVVIAKR